MTRDLYGSPDGSEESGLHLKQLDKENPSDLHLF